MNLQPLYDLKERLEHAAIAGTGLLQEDFRLRRAVDTLAPLAGASPVFAKISAGAKALLAAPQAERSIRLLDVLSLVDAVVYTQGVTNVPGDLAPLAPGGGSYAQVSYGTLQPLLQALSGTGSGRTALIRDAWREHPEYFRDFRVLPHVVSALKDTYAELAEMISQILLAQGPSVIPMLKEGFDPAGKTEMVRRVRLIAGMAGEQENDWYLTILPDSAKEVREAVIQALGLCRSNGQLLLDLCRSERGRQKEAAMRSLARMDLPEGETLWRQTLWRQTYGKKMLSVACLAGVDSPLAAELTANALKCYLADLAEKGDRYNGDTLDKLMKLTAAVRGKYSPSVENMWRWIAENMDRFDEIHPDQKVYNCDLTVAELLQRTMLHSILINPCPEVLVMVRALAESCREWFLCGAFLADMAEMSAAQLYDAYAPMIVTTGLLKKENAAQRNQRIQILRGLAMVTWNDNLRAYCTSFIRDDFLTGNAVQAVRKLDGLDRRWITLLADPKVKDDGGVYYPAAVDVGRKVDPARGWMLCSFINQDDPEVCAEIGSWLYQYTLETGRLQESFQPLMHCGWQNWKGVLVHCVRKQGTLNFDMLYSVLGRIPMSNADKAQELRQLDALVGNGQIRIQFRWPHEWIQRQIALLESGQNA